MENKINIFQVVLLCTFGAIAIIGVIVFATYRSEGNGSGASSVPVVIWGTLPSGPVDQVIKEFEGEQSILASAKYIEKDPRTFFGDITEALAAGRGPDMVIITQSAIIPQRQKFATLSFEQYPERTFKESFVEAGSIFLTPAGIIAIPLVVDPMVLYWNTERFSAAGLALPPVYWQEMYDLVPKLATVENDFTVSKSAIALGEYGNVTNAKALLSTLFLQAGATTVEWVNNRPTSVFGKSGANAAVRFYVEFADPTRAAYNWNRSLRSSRDMFLSGDLAMYPGFASEFEFLRDANPNLPFDIALLPQARTTTKRATFANVYGLAVTNASANKSAAWAVGAALSAKAPSARLAELLSLGPIRRDVASGSKPLALDSILSESAIISRTWLEPGAEATDRVFSRMIDSITTRRLTLDAAIAEAATELADILK